MINAGRSHLVITAITAVALELVLLQPRPACGQQLVSPAQVNPGPIVESVFDTLAFIRWTTQNPGGTILHFAVVHYGKDPNHLDLTAESPTRMNPAHSDMIFRVRIDNLLPGTTYYYKVSSRQANGIVDPAPNAVSRFTTMATNPMSAKN
jgi:Purple acid Phosphatase, N-terminal domain